MFFDKPFLYNDLFWFCPMDLFFADDLFNKYFFLELINNYVEKYEKVYLKINLYRNRNESSSFNLSYYSSYD